MSSFAHQYPLTRFSGADDDGSGTTSSVEAVRALAAANFTPSTPVEFMYFSAEEGGLLGSQAIAKSYEDKGVKVLAMLQIDMTAWVKTGTKESVGIIQDFVDPGLTDFVHSLVDQYRMCWTNLLGKAELMLCSGDPIFDDPVWVCLFRSCEFRQGRLSVKLRVSSIVSRKHLHTLTGRSIESSFENSNHNIHTSQDTMDHPEFSFSHMRECVSLYV